jgi:hypothetical protein
MVHYHNIEQGSPEWFELRKRKLTASHATAIGASGAGLKTYCKEIVLSIIGIEKEEYTNQDIERGNELEGIARAAYEFQTGNEVEQIGFITNDKFENAGASPDGLIGKDGGCEIKARNDIKHLSLILGETKEIPFNQIQMSLLISERKWWDFISFNINFKNPLFIKRIYPDFVYFEKLKKGIIEGNKLIEQILITLNKKNYDFS